MARPYSDVTTKYDMDTFQGRLRYFFEAMNPMLAFENERSLQKHQMLLDRWKDGQAGNVSDRELWRARVAIDQCIHPTSKEVIFPLFRMSMFLPVNFVVVPYMMLPSTVMSVKRTLLVQWFNQSFNSAVNYANRSSDAQPASEIAKAYTLAVAVACGGSLGATAMLRRVPAVSIQGIIIRGTVPFLAVSTAACVNLAFMRKNEWMPSGTGLAVKDQDGVVRGRSTAAGMDSLQKCSVARILWNLPCMMLPTLAMMPLTHYCSAARRYSMQAECLLQMTGLTLGVPPALAFYSLNQTIAARKLEPQLQGLSTSRGSPVEVFSYYKGL